MGIELSQVAVQRTEWQDLIRKGKLVQGSLSSIPWPDDTFDIVFSSEVLEHIPSQQIPACLSEMVRVSRGFLVMTISLRLARADDPSGAPERKHSSLSFVDHPTSRTHHISLLTHKCYSLYAAAQNT
jgi:ubiquinone/menaquinone biosynthesis C-methylase UbiE